jgi:hypothetical protein
MPNWNPFLSNDLNFTPEDQETSKGTARSVSMLQVVAACFMVRFTRCMLFNTVQV